MNSRIRLVRCILLLFYPIIISAVDQLGNTAETDRIIWCTISPEEQKKCLVFNRTLERDLNSFGSYAMRVECKQGSNKDECMMYLDREEADITTLDAGEVFIGGRYHSLIPIMQEVYPGRMNYFYAVAVVKTGQLPEVRSIRDLRGKKACFAGVGTQAGWVIPVYTLMKEGGMEIIDCNNHVKSAINFFGPSCAVNSLVDKYNPIGDNPDKLCALCIGRIPGERCTSADPYAGFEGAFRCLVEKGDIAFLKHTTVEEMTRSVTEFSGVTKEEFQLLCKDGSRATIDGYRNCNWGSVPTHAIVTSSVKSPELRRMYQKFLQKAVQLYGGHQEISRENSTASYDNDLFLINNNNDNDNNNNNNYNVNYNVNNNEYNDSSVSPKPGVYEQFRLFQSAPIFGIHHNLMFQDTTVDLASLPEPQQTYTDYLGHSLDMIMGVRRCPVNRMTLCVTSNEELEKCIKMRTALKAQLLRPEMICYKGHSQIHCMQAIRNGNADVAVLDAGDVYTAGLQYDLIPFIAEVYNLGLPEYYVVAVAKEDDPDTELTYLKGKRTCHAGINTAAGWIIPLAYLMSNGWIRSYGCNSVRAAAEYFTKSCVPGALSSEYNTGLPYDNLCDLCHGSSYRYCRRDASEDYFGHTGAFRCLVEGGGQVAFVKHTTVTENTDGKRREWWARNTLTDDFELLCPDGTRAPMHEYKRCNLGRVKSNAIVARGGEAYNETEINAFINLFIYAQQFYGRKDQDDFRL
ncbi:transferrin 2 isoform X2 [Anabrus simplex]|uniref:transferrin 2 isoform X2 n=1 Tax=Anabrus simplex TaxID=316456 RepID=UPI0035A39048